MVEWIQKDFLIYQLIADIVDDYNCQIGHTVAGVKKHGIIDHISLIFDTLIKR